MSTATERETNEAYHADHDHVGKSMLDVFRQSRPRFHQRFVAETMPQPDPTQSMRRGSLFHLLVLEPERYATLTLADTACEATIKSGDRKGKRCTNNATATDDQGRWLCGTHSKGLELNPPHTEYVIDDESGVMVPLSIVSVEEDGTVKAMRDALFANPVARNLIERDGERESTHRWVDSSGVKCKVRPDLATDAYLLDLKSAHDVSPEGFAKAAANLGYHRQDDWYTTGWADKTGGRLPFVFLAVDSKPPHEVAMYSLHDDAKELAATQNRSALQQLAACYRNDDWESPCSKRINTLSLPRWSVYAEEYQTWA